MKESAKGRFFENCTVMGDLKGAPAVHFNFPLLSFYLCTTFKTGIAATGESIPSEEGRFGECLLQLLKPFTKPPLFRRNRLTGSGNPIFESCVEVKAQQR